MYTVTEVSKISGVTVKTLYHYHKINLLIPSRIGENNYRYYGTDEINRLQHILFYRALDFSLEDIKTLLDTDINRLGILKQQQSLLLEKKEELGIMLETIDKSIQEEQQRVDGTIIEKDSEEQLSEDKDKFKGLDEVNPIGRTMQNMVVIFSKPMYIQYLVLGITLIIAFSILLIDSTKYPLRVSDFWFHKLEPSSQKITAITFIVVGFVSIGVSIRGLFFTKTKDLLDIVNKPYINKEKKIQKDKDSK